MHRRRRVASSALFQNAGGRAILEALFAAKPQPALDQALGVGLVGIALGAVEDHVLDALAQLGVVLACSSEPFDPTTSMMYFLGVDKVKFRRAAVPRGGR